MNVFKEQLAAFLEFVRKQGVIGLAVGFVLGGAVTQVVGSLVNDIVNPLLGPILGAAGDLKSMDLQFGPVTIKWGNFANTVINFVVIAAVVYYGILGLGLNKLDKPKE